MDFQTSCHINLDKTFLSDIYNFKKKLDSGVHIFILREIGTKKLITLNITFN